MLDESAISYFYLKESLRNDNIRNNPVYLKHKKIVSIIIYSF